jgi:hypothetical protein
MSSPDKKEDAKNPFLEESPSPLKPVAKIKYKNLSITIQRVECIYSEFFDK